MEPPDYPYLGEIGLWTIDTRGHSCYACHGEIPAGERYFAYALPERHTPVFEPGGTPYHRACALYAFSDGPKPPALYAYPTSREELARPLPEPEFPGVPGQWRTARKPWVCRSCANMIRVGARYFEYTGETPLYEHGRPYHRACAISTWSWSTAQEEEQTDPCES